MNQRINFYTDSFKPKVDYLSLNLSAAYMGALIAVLMVMTLVQWFGQRQLRDDVSAALAARAEWQAQMTQLEQVIESRARDPALELTAEQLERDQKDKLTLRQF